MLTADGIVQEGDVAPKSLIDLATMVTNCNCKASTCANPDDAELIDLMRSAQRLGAGAGTGVASR